MTMSRCNGFVKRILMSPGRHIAKNIKLSMVFGATRVSVKTSRLLTVVVDARDYGQIAPDGASSFAARDYCNCNLNHIAPLLGKSSEPLPT